MNNEEKNLCELLVARTSGLVVESQQILWRFLPCQPVLVELDDDERTLGVRLRGRHQIGVLGVLPAHQEQQLAAGVGGA